MIRKDNDKDCLMNMWSSYPILTKFEGKKSLLHFEVSVNEFLGYSAIQGVFKIVGQYLEVRRT